MARTYTARETRWVAEYCAEKFPDAYQNGKITYQQSLGPLAAGFTSRMAPRVDAVIDTPISIILLEAEIENPTMAIGQLLLYRDQFTLTPAYTGMSSHAVTCLLLLAYPNAPVQAQAAKYGMWCDIWCPEWLRDYIVNERGYHLQ